MMDSSGKRKSILAALFAMSAMAFTVPANAINSAPNEGAWLGVYIQDVTPQMTKHFSVDSTQGSLVNQVIAGSPADVGGIEPGDIIRRFDDTTVETSEHLRQLVSQSRAGSLVHLALIRDGLEISLEVLLQSKPEETSTWSFKVPAPEEPLEVTPLERWILVSHEGAFGARMADLNPALGEYFPGTDGSGIIILEVCPDSAAEHAGLEPGDVLIEVSSHPLQERSDLRDEIRSSDAKSLPFVALRHGERIEVQMELANGPECWKGPQRSFFRFKVGQGPDHFQYQIPKIDPKLFGAPEADWPLKRKFLKWRFRPEKIDELRDELELLKSEMDRIRTEIRELTSKTEPVPSEKPADSNDSTDAEIGERESP